MTRPEHWRISVDTGGTFTDCWALDPEGNERRCKVLSSGGIRSRIAALPGTRTVRLEDAWETAPGFFEGFTLRAGLPCAVDVSGWNPSAKELALADFIPPEIQPGALIELTSREEAPVLGVRLLTGTPLGADFPSLKVRLATTIATNALLERKGEHIAFLVTRGFGDLLRIGDQRRPDLFALEHRLPEPLYDEVLEIDERLDASGRVLSPLEITPGLTETLRRLAARGIRSAAVALLHSYRNPVHERQLGEALRRLGFEHVSLSSELAPFIKLLPRAQTTVINASLSTIVESFFDRIDESLGPSREAPPRMNDDTQSAPRTQLLVMTSSGGLETRRSSHAKDVLLSGPAGGVVGAAAAARACGHEKILTFDMGGTSTDVARFDGDFLYQFEQRIGDAVLLAPALNIHTVAAGGGSICSFDEITGLKVGPESAGAAPGPASYGKGGPLTITDVNLLLGRINPDRATIPLNKELSRAAFDRLLASMGAPSANEERRRAILEGLLAIAVERMADAIRAISIRDGAAPEDYALVAFGGAGPLHACAVAEQLGIDRIIVPADAGLLSAFGLHNAVLERFAEKQFLRDLKLATPSLEAELENLARQACARLAAHGAADEEIVIRRRIAELRLFGQDSSFAIDIGADVASLKIRFAARYEETYGYQPPSDRAVELVTLRVIASTRPPAIIPEEEADATPPARLDTARAGDFLFFDRAALVPGAEFSGPATVQDNYSTLLVAPGWRAEIAARGTLLLHRASIPAPRPASGAPESTPGIHLELFRNRFQNIVEEMGARLQRSALSTNIKERADFSCALLDARGRLVVNAPHIPVHLGALGLCVRNIIAHRALRPGDMIVTNHPAFGGSHLPDVTVISPVFVEDQRQAGSVSNESGASPVAYVANRAHHAEIGGITPGSMPPNARNLAEEGAVIPPTLLFEAGVPDYEAVRELLTTRARHPTRSLDDNIADLNAQAAANLHGVRAFQSLVASSGIGAVAHHLEELTARSRDALRLLIENHPVPAATAREELDDGTPISLTLQQKDGALHFDFTGTGERHPGSLNATPAIVQSAVLYALRLFSRTALPLNEGLLEDVRITLPVCFLNPVFSDDLEQCPAVVGGNVETSQRLVDTLLKALHVQACSQGTMNNFILGDATFGYYETIAGGAGAGSGYPGCGPLHTHMTNTAITDPEILEHRYPVRLVEFSVRRGSGGPGRFPGGDGAVREVEFLKPLTVSLLTQHRKNAPYGSDGGGSGSPGRQFLISPGGGKRELPPSIEIQVKPGERLRIETPGGGGWGSASRR